MWEDPAAGMTVPGQVCPRGQGTPPRRLLGMGGRHMHEKKLRFEFICLGNMKFFMIIFCGIGFINQRNTNILPSYYFIIHYCHYGQMFSLAYKLYPTSKNLSIL